MLIALHHTPKKDQLQSSGAKASYKMFMKLTSGICHRSNFFEQLGLGQSDKTVDLKNKELF